MKFLCRQEILLRILHMGTRALAAKTTLPILSGLLLESRENELYCASTDLEIGIEVKIPEVSILEPGRVVVPGKVFYEIIRHLPPGDLEVGTDGEKKALTIKGKNSFFQLHLLPDEEYPLLPERIDEKRAKDQGAMVFFCRWLLSAKQSDGRFTPLRLRIRGLSSPVSLRNFNPGGYA